MRKAAFKLAPVPPAPARPATRPTSEAVGPDAHELRCDCGKLLARVLPAVLELKCSRCKRVVLVAEGRRFEPAGGHACNCGVEP